MLASTEDIFFSSDMPKEVVGGSTILRRHDDGKEIELKQPAPGYATIFRYVRKITRSSDDERGRVRVVQTQRGMNVLCRSFTFRGSGVFHRGSAANYKRIIYVKTMEFKDVTILDKVRAGVGAVLWH